MIPKIAAIFGIIGAFGGLAESIMQLAAKFNLVTLFKVISDGANAASQTLARIGKMKIAQFLGLISTVAGFISSGFKKDINPDTGKTLDTMSFKPTNFEILKLVRSNAEQVASLAGATRIAEP